MFNSFSILDITAALSIFFGLLWCKKHINAWLLFSFGFGIYCVLCHLKDLNGLCVLSAILCVVGVGIFLTKPRDKNAK